MRSSKIDLSLDRSVKAYVPNLGCYVPVMLPGETVGKGRTAVEDHEDYEPWRYSKEETLAMIDESPRNPRVAWNVANAKRVAIALGWCGVVASP